MSDSVLFLPEEICTLVIAETFPEDAGIFTCSASNDYGSAASTAQLVVTSGTPGPHCRKDHPEDRLASRSHAKNPCFITKQKAGVGGAGRAQGPQLAFGRSGHHPALPAVRVVFPGFLAGC